MENKGVKTGERIPYHPIINPIPVEHITNPIPVKEWKEHLDKFKDLDEENVRTHIRQILDEAVGDPEEPAPDEDLIFPWVPGSEQVDPEEFDPGANRLIAKSAIDRDSRVLEEVAVDDILESEDDELQEPKEAESYSWTNNVTKKALDDYVAQREASIKGILKTDMTKLKKKQTFSNMIGTALATTLFACTIICVVALTIKLLMWVF